MGDKLTNVLIVFIIVVILALGGMYYVKIIGNKTYSIGGTISYGEEVENNSSAITANANTVSTNQEENRPTIGGVAENNSGNTIQSTNQSGYKHNNRYYYNSLEKYSKVIYDAIANNMETLKSGNQRVDIDYDFAKLLNSTNGQEQLKDYYEDAINALNLDIPHLFYVELSHLSLEIERTTNIFSTTYKLYIDADKYPNYWSKGFNSKEQVEGAVKDIENIKNQVKSAMIGSDYYKVRRVHDWIIDNMYYDLSSEQRASVYGAFIEKKGVCESYARAYKYILDDLGIENILVTGTGTNSSGQTEDHMWNYVKLNGTWYAVDVTWDDPIIVGGGTISEETKHKYFLNGSREFFKSHTEKLTISPSERIFAPPKLSIDNY